MGKVERRRKRIQDNRIFKKLGEIKAKYEMETEITIEDAAERR